MVDPASKWPFQCDSTVQGEHLARNGLRRVSNIPANINVLLADDAIRFCYSADCSICEKRHVRT